MGLAPETLRRTNLGLLSSGRLNLKIVCPMYFIMLDCMYFSKVNIERALRADGRNSGHFVQVTIKNYIFTNFMQSVKVTIIRI